MGVDEEYEVLVSEEARSYLDDLDGKSRRIVVDNLRKLATHPYPGRGPGDKERIGFRGREAWRMHIGRTHTAFYRIDEDARQVRVLEIMSIDDAHKAYGQ